METFRKRSYQGDQGDQSDRIDQGGFDESSPRYAIECSNRSFILATDRDQQLVTIPTEDRTEDPMVTKWWWIVPITTDYLGTFMICHKNPWWPRHSGDSIRYILPSTVLGEGMGAKLGEEAWAITTSFLPQPITTNSLPQPVQHYHLRANRDQSRALIRTDDGNVGLGVVWYDGLWTITPVGD